MMSQPPASHWIGGKPLEDLAGAPLPVLYPATGAVIATLALAIWGFMLQRESKLQPVG